MPPPDAPPVAAAVLRLHALKPDAVVLKSLLTLERKLWSKSESWGGLLEAELQRRNTTLLYTTGPPTLDGSAVQAVGGYILYTTTGLVAHISKLMVAPVLRRRGIGRALVREAVALAQRERRVGSVTLHVDSSNAAALGLYRSLGFASEAVLPVSSVCTPSAPGPALSPPTLEG
jgi:ribosomal protein S18 acetylase RimI-like enzyme